MFGHKITICADVLTHERSDDRMVRGFCIALVFLASTTSGGADELFFRKDSVTVFGGVYTTVNMHQSFSPIADHDSTYLIAAAYRREFVKLPWNVVIGGEAGVGFRFGSGSFGEIWAAPTIRVVGIPLGSFASMSLGVSAGFSAITNPTGLERQREQEHSGDTTLLFYFSPELAFAFADLPNIEFVLRLHHRSGLYGTLGRMREGSNAQTVGVRWLF
jgi:hypothetical protein